MRAAIVDKASALEEHKNTISLIERLLKKYSSSYEIIAKEDLNKALDDFDLVIAAGGDGTLLYTASFVDSALVLAVNSAPQHSVGNLTSANASDLEEKLGRFYKGYFSVLNRTRLNVEIDSKHVGLALNEIYMGSIKPFGIAARYAIKVDDKEEEQKSSGIIVSTGTGSTAMFKHFGKAFKANADYAKYAAVFPIGNYKLIGGKVREITVISGMTKNDLLTIDGWQDFNYGHKTIIRVSIADKPLRTIEFG
ncbi:MAG: hypothetical protein Q7J54_05690 [Candidatus Woesearchaeota archaeon]|nr:hypothetical protein [Candidatus Woesearchaeota archaeon]